MMFSKWPLILALVGTCCIHSAENSTASQNDKKAASPLLLSRISSLVISPHRSSPPSTKSHWCVSQIKHTAHQARCSCGHIKGFVPRIIMLRRINAIEEKGLGCCKGSKEKCDCLTPIYQELNEIIESCSLY